MVLIIQLSILNQSKRILSLSAVVGHNLACSSRLKTRHPIIRPGPLYLSKTQRRLCCQPKSR